MSCQGREIRKQNNPGTSRNCPTLPKTFVLCWNVRPRAVALLISIRHARVHSQGKFFQSLCSNARGYSFVFLQLRAPAWNPFQDPPTKSLVKVFASSHLHSVQRSVKPGHIVKSLALSYVHRLHMVQSLLLGLPLGSAAPCPTVRTVSHRM